ncbi:2Fe-2S iron-sulfur cluster binding domain protein [Aeromicrobium marinum DSM 15272]|uniref:2Fe-2S iron-sulfur cluster binding domain protein n=1 Tax=Aeromicrobium marinum DSM 15272 TaxID=585531 RepID=E2SEK4_9ACTN|nr:ferredoxin--NADP reductase [Aeromicrobium marinum]EFQ82301.1 2Fe-2S iron-sulfur cluster binding domain protein [Aeromicrobium marinum DSM 15272]
MSEGSFELDVLDVVEEAAGARSVVLDPGEHAASFGYTPGQFLTVAVPSDRTGLVARSYSLSSSPVDQGPLTITVKPTDGGYASNWICDHVRAGDRLRVLPPSGIFTPADLDADLLLFAGGSGITPVLSIVRTALARGSGRIVLFYANRDERSVIFGPVLAALAAEHPERLQVVHWLESVQGLPTQAQLKAFAGSHAEWDAFVCGPAPFMAAAVAALKELGFPRSRRHQEKFVSLGGNPFDIGAPPAVAPVADDAPAAAATHLQVELDGEQHEFTDWRAGTTLLEHLERNGVKAPFSCREGECSACAVRLLEGDVTMRNNDVLDEEDLADGIRLACQSDAASEKVRVTYS